MKTRLSLTSLLVVLALACGSTKHARTLSPNDLPSAKFDSAGTPFIVVTKDAIALDGTILADAQPIERYSRPQRIQPVFDALKARHDADGPAAKPDLWVEARLATGVPAVSAIMSGVFAGYRHVHLLTDDGWIEGEFDMPGPPDDAAPPVHSRIIVRLGGGEAQAANLGWQSDRPCEVVPHDADTTRPRLAAYLDEACSRQPAPCVDVAHVRFTTDVPFTESLLALETIRRHAGARFVFTLLPTNRATAAKDPTRTCGMPIHTGINGELAASEIRRVVEVNFTPMRRCYEEGLARNAKLQGRVAIRFVIDRDGTVSEAKPEGDPFPDPTVVSCVVRVFKGLSFPKPEGGVVTALYPLSFSPE